MPNFLLVAPEVVMTTTADATSNDISWYHDNSMFSLLPWLPFTEPVQSRGGESEMQAATRTALIKEACAYCAEEHVFVGLQITRWTRDQTWYDDDVITWKRQC